MTAAVFMRRFNAWATLAWLALIPISVLLGWVYSIAFISAISLYANVAGHLSAWQAARVEEKQDAA